LHHNPDQWGIDHDVFRPERFAQKGRQHPMSFMPFLAGKRVCVGKTFAENSFKVVMPLILKAFPHFEFVNLEHYKLKPANNLSLDKRPEILIKFSIN
jgi:cytochrome P450